MLCTHQILFETETRQTGWACSTYGGGKDSCAQVLMEKSEERRPFGRPRRIRENNIKAVVQEVG
jgi:hypothetical protein